ncbi:hypothetical protein OFN12_32675, partial [Escherichia coli]|nr:hypothetical protein [Escherichia coli]
FSTTSTNQMRQIFFFFATNGVYSRSREKIPPTIAIDLVSDTPPQKSVASRSDFKAYYKPP